MAATYKVTSATGNANSVVLSSQNKYTFTGKSSIETTNADDAAELARMNGFIVEEVPADDAEG